MSHTYLSIMRSSTAENGNFLLCECLHFMSRSTNNTQEFNYEH